MDDIQHVLPLPASTGDLDLGEPAPIVSSCAVCARGLKLYEITVMMDGEHVCLSSRCHDTYIERTSESTVGGV